MLRREILIFAYENNVGLLFIARMSGAVSDAGDSFIRRDHPDT